MEEVKTHSLMRNEAELSLQTASSPLVAPYMWQDTIQGSPAQPQSAPLQIPITVHTISGHLARAIRSLKLSTIAEAQ